MNKGKIEQIGTPQEVYEHPATPYVYNFLGNVNQFETEVIKQTARIDALNISINTDKDIQEGPALAYIRPHELAIHQEQKSASFQAKINHIYAVGPIIRVELEQQNKGIIEAEITKEEFKLLNLVAGQSVYLTAKNVQLFSAPNH